MNVLVILVVKDVVAHVLR